MNFIAIFLLLVVLPIVVLSIVVYRFFRKGIHTVPGVTQQLEVDATPDKPVAFGYKMIWLAVKTNDTEAVVNALSLTDVQAANWQTGVEAAYHGRLFVSPPLDDWTFVLSRELPQDDELQGQLAEFLSVLSARFGEVQYFATHRVVEFHAWALYRDGREIRAFAYIGDQGELSADRGNKTAAELESGFDYFNPDHPELSSEDYWEREDLEHPQEEDVMAMAGKWSIDPQQLEQRDFVAGAGYVATINGA
jgi:hypothetical protein